MIALVIAIAVGLPGRALVADDTSLASYSAAVKQICVVPDGKHLVTVSVIGGKSDVRVWSAAGRSLRTLTTKNHFPMTAAISPDGRMVATGGWEGRIYFWSLPDGKVLFSLDGHAVKEDEDRDVQVTSIAFSPDGKELVSASHDGTVRFWSVANRNENGATPEHANAGAPDGWVFGVAYSPDGKRLARVANRDPLRQWERATMNDLEAIPAKGWTQAWQVVYSPDGKTLAAATNDIHVRLWDAKTGKEVLRLAGHESSVTAVAFSPDGKMVASADTRGVIRLWDFVTGKELAKLAEHGAVVRSLVFLPKGDVLLSAGGDTSNNEKVLRWDVRSRKKLPWE